MRDDTMVDAAEGLLKKLIEQNSNNIEAEDGYVSFTPILVKSTSCGIRFP